jgi:hypothetical protein
MRWWLNGVVAGLSLMLLAGATPAALAQDVTYPVEDQPAAAKPAAAPKPQKPAAAAIPLPKVAARPAPKLAAKVEAKIEPKLEAKIEIKIEAKPETKPEPKFEIKEAKAPAEPSLPGIAAEERASIGYSVVSDPNTGIQLGLPVKWVPKSTLTENGTRWASRHGDIQVETFRIKTGESLNVLFEKQKRDNNRRIETSGLRPDGFTVTGLQGLKKFGVRAQLKNGELRGYTVLFDQAIEGVVAPVTLAMAGAFAPFPEAAMPMAALGRPVDYGSGLVVSAEGHVLTDRRYTENCTVITVAGLGNAERVALDGDSGLALLRVYGKRGLRAAALAADSPSGDVTLAGVPDPHLQNGGATIAEVKAQLSGAAIRLREPVPMAGFSGAAALDGQGRVVGMMEARNAQLASTDPWLPPVRFVPAAAMRDFLKANNVATPQAAADARSAVVRVICVRK